MAQREADKREFKLNKLKADLNHYREAQKQVHALERLSLNPDFLEFKKIQEFEIGKCKESINDQNVVLANAFTTKDQERKSLAILRDETARKNTLEEMFDIATSSGEAYKKIGVHIELLQEQIKLIEEEKHATNT